MIALAPPETTRPSSAAAIAEHTPRQITVQPVVMAGGVGTRLWPLSREQYPKQFLALSGEQTLLQQAILRGKELGASGLQMRQPLVVGNESHRFMLQEQLREVGLGDVRILLEPVGRNTAPALTLAALCAQTAGEDPVLVVTPSDQTITDAAAYFAAAEHTRHRNRGSRNRLWPATRP